MVRFRRLSKKYGSILIVDHIFGGGANYYREDLIKSNLLPILVTNDFKIRFIDREYDREITYIFFDFEEILDYILKRFNVKEFIINELVGFDNIFDVINTLVSLKNKYKNVVFSFKVHDFYAVCPIYTLINQNLQFCNVPEDINYCFECYKNNEIKYEEIPNIKSFGIKEPEDLAEWRKSFSKLLEIMDRVECFSLSSANILEKVYPHIKDKLIINPHKVKYIRKIQRKNCRNEKLRIAVVGVIRTVKGGHIVYNLADYIQNNNFDIEIHLFGNIMPKYLHKRIFYHGRYNREELPKIIEENCIDLIFIPSIWPETFSYTTEEAIMMDIPVAVFNLGAPAERVREYRKGLILESTDPEYILKEITQFISKVKSGTLE
jgi:glycosyltransferase involved in cell wall biosynthesis